MFNANTTYFELLKQKMTIINQIETVLSRNVCKTRNI